MRLATFLTAALLAAAVAPVHAHDFWIEPSTFRPARDARIEIALKVGERFAGDSVARNAKRIARFTCTTSAGETNVAGFDDRAPAGLLRTATPGLAWLAYASTPAPLELDAKKFEAYLAEEGLEAVIAERRARGEGAQPGREQYRRSSKALLVVGDAPHAGSERVLGLPLELVPRTDPSVARAGETLEFVVLYEGQPLANALVGCRAKADAEHETRARSDAEGRVRFELAAEGPQLLRVVHMVRAPEGSGADWLSTWGALAFDALPALQREPKPALQREPRPEVRAPRGAAVPPTAPPSTSYSSTSYSSTSYSSTSYSSSSSPSSPARFVNSRRTTVA